MCTTAHDHILFMLVLLSACVKELGHVKYCPMCALILHNGVDMLIYQIKAEHADISVVIKAIGAETVVQNCFT